MANVSRQSLPSVTYLQVYGSFKQMVVLMPLKKDAEASRRARPVATA
jgi:hypothetical protein